MKKRERTRKDGNVILFPELEKRLLEKGIECLQSKEFKQAIELFEEALSIEPANKDAYIGLVLAYYETGAFQKAKHLSGTMLKEGIGDYFETVELYLMILVQLHQYEDIVTTIEALLEEKEVPAEKTDHFLKLLDFSKRMADEQPIREENVLEEADEGELLFDNSDPNALLLTVARLANKNIRPFIKEISEYLDNEEGHPFIKTMLINTLKEQDVDQEISIEKFGWRKTINPTGLFDIYENEEKDRILNILKNDLESDDPILLQHITSLFERHLFLLYPFPLVPSRPPLWAAAYHFIGSEYNGRNHSVHEMVTLYGINAEELEEACAFIQKLEEISYPII
jgi:tetratricopeptide (TPR) repeat protein